jgi:hypothetical protein
MSYLYINNELTNQGTIKFLLTIKYHKYDLNWLQLFFVHVCLNSTQQKLSILWHNESKLKDCCHTMSQWAFFYCLYSVWSCQKFKNNVKNIFFALIPVQFKQNNKRFLKDCSVTRWIVKIYSHVRNSQNKMAANSKSSLRYYGVTVIF